MDRRITVEICVGDVESAIAAEVGGADRVELCDNMPEGGTTPSAGTIAETCRWLSIPVHVLIRPRIGDFVYSERERSVMRHDIEAAKALGAAGVVLDALTRERTIDRDLISTLVAMARPMSITFHKAIDQSADPSELLHSLMSMGVDRVLTSGGCPTVLEGVETLRSLVEHAGDRIAVMAGGRLALDHLETVIRRGQVAEVHLGSAVLKTSSSPESIRTPDGSEIPGNRVDARRVSAVVDLVEGLGQSIKG